MDCPAPWAPAIEASAAPRAHPHVTVIDTIATMPPSFPERVTRVRYQTVPAAKCRRSVFQVNKLENGFVIVANVKQAPCPTALAA